MPCGAGLKGHLPQAPRVESLRLGGGGADHAHDSSCTAWRPDRGDIEALLGLRAALHVSLM